MRPRTVVIVARGHYWFSYRLVIGWMDGIVQPVAISEFASSLASKTDLQGARVSGTRRLLGASSDDDNRIEER